MNFDQIVLFGLFGTVFAFLIWGRWRYDLVAFAALLMAVVLGVVPAHNAFAGFGHPATIIVGLVLIVSRGLSNAGAVDLITRRIAGTGAAIRTHIAVMSTTGASLSAVMNNVAAMALLMPIDMQAAAKAGRTVRRTLMPLSFATILGGLVTLIGTPPNIIIASFRERALGESFSMFDFTPVGATCAIVGVAFVTLVGWRLVPRVDEAQYKSSRNIGEEGYIAELMVPADSKAIGQEVRELYPTAGEDDVEVLGVIRNGRRLSGFSARTVLSPNDLLLVEASAEDLDRFRGAMGLEYFGEQPTEEAVIGDLKMMEVVVPSDARIDGRSALSLRLRARKQVALLGISRQGKRFKNRVRHEPVRAGDILLLLGPSDVIDDVADWLGVLRLAERGLSITWYRRAWLAAGIFGTAIALTTVGLLHLAPALAIVVVLYVILDVVPIRELYENIEWPVIVLLGSMIPLGLALEESGGTGFIASQIVSVSAGLQPWVVLTILMVVIMTLSDVLNNTATAVIGAPIAIEIATALQVNPDPFLMAVAIAASCAFLTPIGHKNNTLIMGPGGYAFGDYWRMGLPLEIIIVAVAIPMILIVFPL